MIHFGSTFTRENIKQLLSYVGVLEPFSELIEAPKEIQLVMREKAGKRYLFALNYKAGKTMNFCSCSCKLHSVNDICAALS